MGKGNTNYGRTVGGTTSAPWEAQQPFIQQGLSEASNQLNSGSTVAPFSPQTQQGLNMTQSVAGASQIPSSAANLMNSTLGGSYLSPTSWMGGAPSSAPGGTGGAMPAPGAAPTSRPDRPTVAGMPSDQRQAALGDWRTQMDAWRDAGRPRNGSAPTGTTPGGAPTSGGMYQNQYIDQLAQSIGNKVVPGVMSNFGTSGRSGTSALANSAVASGISDSLAPYMFGSAENQMGRMFDSYQSERDRQMQALGMAPGIDQLQYSPANAMLGVGGAYDQQAQAQLDNPAQKLSQYMNIAGLPFGSQTTTDITAPTSQEKPLGVGNVLTK